MKRLLPWMLCSLLPAAAFAETAVIDNFHAQPNMVFSLDETPVLFSARVVPDPARPLKTVHLLRLQADGRGKPVAPMHDDGKKGDEKAGDGIYSCRLKLNEPLAGILSFNAEAVYKGSAEQGTLLSRPLFIEVMGGLDKKDRAGVARTMKKAELLYARYAKDKGATLARLDVSAWLMKQPGVIAVGPTPEQNLVVQFASGPKMLLQTGTGGKP
jgi:hypothetical protein